MESENSIVKEEPHEESSFPGIAGLYCDTRLSGQPRYVLTDNPESLMNVPDNVRKSVLFLGHKNPDGMFELMGTAFFMSRIIGLDRPNFVDGDGSGFGYLVTAKHVIDGIRDRFGTVVGIRANLKDGNARWYEMDINKWIFHPTESDFVDVAIFRGAMPEGFDHMTIPITLIASEETISETRIGIGDEVFLTGLFAYHHGTKKNIPIVRVGNIAAMPEEPVEVRNFGLMDAYLIEARSLGGISGSPVFVHIPAARAKSLIEQSGAKLASDTTVYFLLGLMHGHWDEMCLDEDSPTEDAGKINSVNLGIAIVVPATKILEVIEQPMIRKDEERRLREKREKNLPTTDSLSKDEGLTLEGFEDALKQASRKLPSQPDEEKKETEYWGRDCSFGLKGECRKILFTVALEKGF